MAEIRGVPPVNRSTQGGFGNEQGRPRGAFSTDNNAAPQTASGSPPNSGLSFDPNPRSAMERRLGGQPPPPAQDVSTTYHMRDESKVTTVSGMLNIGDRGYNTTLNNATEKDIADIRKGIKELNNTRDGSGAYALKKFIDGAELLPDEKKLIDEKLGSFSAKPHAVKTINDLKDQTDFQFFVRDGANVLHPDDIKATKNSLVEISKENPNLLRSISAIESGQKVSDKDIATLKQKGLLNGLDELSNSAKYLLADSRRADLEKSGVKIEKINVEAVRAAAPASSAPSAPSAPAKPAATPAAAATPAPPQPQQARPPETKPVGIAVQATPEPQNNSPRTPPTPFVESQTAAPARPVATPPAAVVAAQPAAVPPQPVAQPPQPNINNLQKTLDNLISGSEGKKAIKDVLSARGDPPYGSLEKAQKALREAGYIDDKGAVTRSGERFLKQDSQILVEKGMATGRPNMSIVMPAPRVGGIVVGNDPDAYLARNGYDPGKFNVTPNGGIVDRKALFNQIASTAGPVTPGASLRIEVIDRKNVVYDSNLSDRPALSATPSPKTDIPPAGDSPVLAKGSGLSRTAGAAGVGMAAVGLNNALANKDRTGAAIAGADLAVSTADLAADTAKSLGKNVPGALGKAFAKANVAVTVADGIYQVSQEKTVEHKLERAAAVTATAGTGIGIGTVAAGIGAAGTAATAATVAAPVVAAVAVGVTADAAIDARRAWSNYEKIASENRAQPTKNENMKLHNDTGAPSIYRFKNLPAALTEVSRDMNDRNMGNTAPRTKDGIIDLTQQRKLDMMDPRNRAEFEKALNHNIDKQSKIIKDNESVLPNWTRIFSTDEVAKMEMAKMKLEQLQAAKTEFEMFKKDVTSYNNTQQAGADRRNTPADRVQSPGRPTDIVADGGIKGKDGKAVAKGELVAEFTPAANGSSISPDITPDSPAPQVPTRTNRNNMQMSA